jgi:hypothetical protein
MNKIMLTSIPSTGTHLMLKFFQLVDIRPIQTTRYDFFDESMWDNIRALKPGYYSAWHFMWYQRLSDLLKEREVRAVFIYRDPRAQARASVHHIMKNELHPLHSFFSEQLQTLDERLIRVIEGMPLDEFEIVRQQGGLDHGTNAPTDEEGKGPVSKYPSGLNNIHRFYSRWFDDPSCHCVKFEDIIGPCGGGDREKQLHAVQDLIEYTGVDMSKTSVESIADRLFDTNADTFRKGRIDSWREEMSPEIQKVFVRECGEILQMWGYDLEPS